MIVPDINLLIYAHNERAPEHSKAREWWENCLNGVEPVGLPWISIAGYVRLMTHPRVLERPLEVAAAIAHVREWLQQPSVRVLQPGAKFSDLFLSYLAQLGTAGNLTTDAQLAALAVEYQAELYSADTDFARFSGLRWRNPLK
jgi:toxin-antitoxin system PIN domain toxin